MRKLILQMQMSVDGFVSTTKRESWQIWDFSDNWTWDDDLKQEFNAIFAAIDCILLSRKMVEEGYIDHWTKTAKKFAGESQYAFARKIVDCEKVVFSNRLDEAPWHRTTLAKGELVEQVNTLKRQRGKDIICFGGTAFASALVAAGLVDEFQFFVNPRALGSGKTIFSSRPTGVDLELRRSRAYACGIVVNRYVPTPVRISRAYNASAEAIYDAWLKPELMKQWLFRSPTHEVTDVKNDPKPGGTFTIANRSDSGEVIEHYGEYLECERPQRLLFSLQVPKHFAGVTRVAVHIERAARGCTLTFTQTGVDKQLTEQAWNDMLDALATVGN